MSRIPLVIGAAVLSGVLSACGSSGGSSPSGTTPSNPTSTRATVALGTTNLGSVLVDDRGRTLYQLSSDKPNQPACVGSCLSVWRPLTVATGAQPKAGTGVTGALGVLTRADGTRQVTIGTHPLYTYSGDTSTGEANGQQIMSYGGIWYVVTAVGAPV